MKQVITIALTTFIFSIYSFGQRELKNGVVVDHDAEKIVKNIAKKLKEDSPMSFNFSFTAEDDDKISANEKGKFLSNGNKFKVMATDFEDYSDGTTVWHYIKTANEVEITNVEEGGSMFDFSNIISNYLQNFRPKLIREEKYESIICNILDLTPLKKSNIMKVRVFVAKNTNRIMKMQIYTSDNKIYTYILTNYQVKQNTSHSDFVFPKDKYPKVQEIDLR